MRVSINIDKKDFENSEFRGRIRVRIILVPSGLNTRFKFNFTNVRQLKLRDSNFYRLFFFILHVCLDYTRTDHLLDNCTDTD